MTISRLISQHLKDVYQGGNWTSSDLKTILVDIDWKDATTQLYDLNTIATLVFHLQYYVKAITKVLQEGPLDAKDKYSFNHPPITSQDDWDQYISTIWEEADQLAALIEQVPEDKLYQDFTDGKYGSYYRNLQGNIEHIHYHLGQIVMLKKIHAALK